MMLSDRVLFRPMVKLAVCPSVILTCKGYRNCIGASFGFMISVASTGEASFPPLFTLIRRI